eukprot:6130233-Pyramimonas_sp.AAC.1
MHEEDPGGTRGAGGSGGGGGRGVRRAMGLPLLLAAGSFEWCETCGREKRQQLEESSKGGTFHNADSLLTALGWAPQIAGA